MRPLNPKPAQPGRWPMSTFCGESCWSAATVPCSCPSSSTPLRYTCIVRAVASYTPAMWYQVFACIAVAP